MAQLLAVAAERRSREAEPSQTAFRACACACVRVRYAAARSGFIVFDISTKGVPRSVPWSVPWSVPFGVSLTGRKRRRAGRFAVSLAVSLAVPLAVPRVVSQKRAVAVLGAQRGRLAVGWRLAGVRAKRVRGAFGSAQSAFGGVRCRQ